ncbi:MAG: CBS domain-containing protein [Nitrososphaera sp.]|jgi:CBS domain-containing protein
MSSLDSIPVSRIMSSPVLTIKENETIQQACKTMINKDIGSVIVVSEQSSEPAGIITERDVVRHLAEKPISFMAQASQIMSRPIVTIHPNGSIRDALQTMQSRNIRRLLVVGDDGKNMMGIVTDRDIFRFISKNESVASSFVSEQVIGKDVSERFATSLFDDLVHRRS